MPVLSKGYEDRVGVIFDLEVYGLVLQFGAVFSLNAAARDVELFLFQAVDVFFDRFCKAFSKLNKPFARHLVLFRAKISILQRERELAFGAAMHGVRKVWAWLIPSAARGIIVADCIAHGPVGDLGFKNA